jgi:hypothetical protein
MIRLVHELGGPEQIVSVLYSAIAAAVVAGVIGGIALAWLTTAAHGGE